MSTTIPPHKWAFTAEHQRILQHKECIAADRRGTQCAGGIVRAHIIPRSQLRQIADKGQIYAVPTSIMAVMQMQHHNAFAPKEISLRNFSTLSCFCAKHDKALFAPIEDVPLIFSPHQLALLHYRALAAEYYQRRNQEEAANTEVLRYEDDDNRADRFIWISYINAKAAAEALDALIRTEKALRKHAYAELSGLVIQFNSKPSVLSVGAFRPTYDCVGNRVQDLRQDNYYAAVHMLSNQSKAAIVLTWLRGDTAPANFAKSFHIQPAERLTSLFIQTAFEHVEHICMSVDWWSRLKQAQRRPLLERVRRANSLSYRRSNRCLTYRIHYGDWGVEKVNFVNA
jgi:hypothetical protein